MSDPGIRRWPAPAKLNLFLHVIGRRKDGYHELQTLFQLLDLCDELQFEVTRSSRILRSAGPCGVPEKEDLAVRSAGLLQAEAGVSSGVRITIHKRIPLGAGLGGGSSDAATTLLVLNELWQCGLSPGELAALGLRLGADVPVFVYGRSALGTGVGEILQPVELGERHYVLVFSDICVSTAEVFRHPQLKRDSLPIALASALAGAGRNDCEAVVRRLYPEFSELFSALEAFGTPRMTGTGSCIFLEMADENAATHTAHELKCRYNVRAVRGLDRSPVHEILQLRT